MGVGGMGGHPPVGKEGIEGGGGKGGRGTGEGSHGCRATLKEPQGLPPPWANNQGVINQGWGDWSKGCCCWGWKEGRATGDCHRGRQEGHA